MDKRTSSPEKTLSTNVKFDPAKLKKITVKIDRKLPGTSETKQLIHTVDKLEELKIYRRHDEGRRPIFERSEINENKKEDEQRTVSTYSPHKSPSRPQNNSHKSSDNYTMFDSNSPRRDKESPRRSSRYSRSPKREHKSSRTNRRSASSHRDSNKPSTSRRDINSSRNRSRSKDNSRRSRRSKSRSRSSRREFARRRNSRSPDERDRRRYERRIYGPNEYNRRRNRSRSPRYTRRRSRSRPPHMAPIDPTAVIPLIIPPFYGAEDAVWFPPPVRPPMLIPPGGPMPPRGMYRPPFPGMRPPMLGRPPFMPLRQGAFRQIRPQNRPQLQ